MNRTIYLLRHGETEWNVARRIQGHLDSPLTARGLAQAERMGATLAALVPDPGAWRMMASPLGRALATARIVADRLGIDPGRIGTDDRLREATAGAWDGRLVDDIAANEPQHLREANHGRAMLASPTGESYADVAARVTAWLADTAAEPRLIVVAHGAVNKVLRGCWLGLGEREAMDLDAPQDAFYRLTPGRQERIACLPALGAVAG